MRGPLPDPNAIRRNKPTIAGRVLPAEGRKGRAPKVPDGIDLGPAGKAWWAWAWKTPQADAWSDGALYALARRAKLEDDFDALELVDGFDLADYLAEDDPAAVRRLEAAIRKLKALAGNKIAVAREARELDTAFGLTEKAMGQLRWSVGDLNEEASSKPAPRQQRRGRHLRAVDTGAVAGT